MTALVLLAAVPIVMWLAQSAALQRAGLPIRWRIDSRDAPPSIRAVGRITTQLSIAAVVVAFPLLKGHGVVSYYASLLPGGRAPRWFVHGAALATVFLAVLFGIWLATGRLEIDVHHSRRKWIRRLALLVPTALLGALAEEMLFRGVLLADLLDSTRRSTWLAVLLGALVFAGAHYVRTVKRRWTLPGHIMLGIVLCLAYVRTGDLWLSTGLHAGGIFMIMGWRPFVRYEGPAWVTGASIFPFAGVVGLVCLGALALQISLYFGPP